jgi:hypothetical protein
LLAILRKKGFDAKVYIGCNKSLPIYAAQALSREFIQGQLSVTPGCTSIAA